MLSSSWLPQLSRPLVPLPPPPPPPKRPPLTPAPTLLPARGVVGALLQRPLEQGDVGERAPHRCYYHLGHGCLPPQAPASQEVPPALAPCPCLPHCRGHPAAAVQRRAALGVGFCCALCGRETGSHSDDEEGLHCALAPGALLRQPVPRHCHLFPRAPEPGAEESQRLWIHQPALEQQAAQCPPAPSPPPLPCLPHRPLPCPSHRHRPLLERALAEVKSVGAGTACLTSICFGLHPFSCSHQPLLNDCVHWVSCHRFAWLPPETCCELSSCRRRVYHQAIGVGHRPAFCHHRQACCPAICCGICSCVVACGTGCGVHFDFCAC
mmetsp:Transcript_106455/g.266808  ORF Transcript_106455/g.266808 Transcript_106455/m.266808 type:complete len:323 (-) Transcript_106455:276-1244(-)